MVVTRDGGRTWRSPGNPPGNPTKIVLDPRRPRTLYLSTSQNRVYRSVDGKVSTWRAFGAGRKGRPGPRPRPGLTEPLAIDPRTPGTLYAGDGLGVVKTVDGGATWRRADAGVVASQVASVAPAASNPTTIYTGGSVSRIRALGWYSVGAALSRSDDGGRTWTALQIDGTDAASWQTHPGSLAVDPHDHRHVLVGGRGGILESRDAGATWTSLLRQPGNWAGRNHVRPERPAADVRHRLHHGREPESPDPEAATAEEDLEDPARYLPLEPPSASPSTRRTPTPSTRDTRRGEGAQIGAGLATSSDGGRSWRYRSIAANNEGPVSLAFAPSDPDTLYAATFSGLARSVDGGDSWRLLPHRRMATFPLKVVVDPQRSETVYVGTGDRGVLRSTDGGATLQPFGARLPRQGVESLAFDPSGSWLYAGMVDAGLASIRVR